MTQTSYEMSVRHSMTISLTHVLDFIFCIIYHCHLIPLEQNEYFGTDYWPHTIASNLNSRFGPLVHFKTLKLYPPFCSDFSLCRHHNEHKPPQR